MRCKSITSTSPQSIQSHSRSRDFPRVGQLEEGENKTKTEGATRKAQKLLLAIPSVIFLFLLFSVVWLEIQPFLPSDKYRRPLLILQTVKNRHKVWQLLEFDKWRREISLTVSANAMRNISFISAFLSRPRFQLPRRPLQGTLVFSRLLHDLFRSARRKIVKFCNLYGVTTHNMLICLQALCAVCRQKGDNMLAVHLGQRTRHGGQTRHRVRMMEIGEMRVWKEMDKLRYELRWVLWYWRSNEVIEGHSCTANLVEEKPCYLIQVDFHTCFQLFDKTSWLHAHALLWTNFSSDFPHRWTRHQNDQNLLNRAPHLLSEPQEENYSTG